MRSGSLRLLSAIAAQLGLGMHRWDFVAAYLQGELLDGEVVYCELPPEISEHDIPGHRTHDAQGRARVCQVVKPIYGMAQAVAVVGKDLFTLGSRSMASRRPSRMRASSAAAAPSRLPRAS